MPKNNSNIYTAVSIFSIISLLLTVFLILPLFQDIEKSSQDLISAKDDIVSLSAQIKETEHFSKNYETYKPNLDQVDQLFINPDNPVDFIQFLEDTAVDSDISSQNSLTPYQKTGQNFIGFQISSQGSFSDVMDFLKKIESGPYLVEVDNLSIQNPADSGNAKAPAAKNDSSRKVDATFSIKAFAKAP